MFEDGLLKRFPRKQEDAGGQTPEDGGVIDRAAMTKARKPEGGAASSVDATLVDRSAMTSARKEREAQDMATASDLKRQIESTLDNTSSEGSQSDRLEKMFVDIDKRLSEAENLVSEVESMPSGSREKYDAAFQMRGNVEDLLRAKMGDEVPVSLFVNERVLVDGLSGDEKGGASAGLVGLMARSKKILRDMEQSWRKAKEEWESSQENKGPISKEGILDRNFGKNQ